MPAFVILGAVLSCAPHGPPVPAPAGREPSCPDGMVLIEGAVLPPAPGSAWTGVPPHGPIELGPFCLDRFEVTVAQYARCVGEGSCRPAPGTISYSGTGSAQARSPHCNGDAEARVDHPINCVGWEDARAYCASRGARLPSELEWELAARGPEGRSLPWGEAPVDATRANVAGAETSRELVTSEERAPFDDGFAGTSPVGAFPDGATPQGVHDLGGNVAEWCEAVPPDPRGRQASRGGAWADADPARTMLGAHLGPSDRDEFTGFRCAAPATAG